MAGPQDPAWGMPKPGFPSPSWRVLGHAPGPLPGPVPGPSRTGPRTRPGRVLGPSQTVQTCLTRQVPPGQVWHFSSLPYLPREPLDPGSGTPTGPWFLGPGTPGSWVWEPRIQGFPDPGFGSIPGSGIDPGIDPESTPNRPQKLPKSWSTFDQLLGSVWGRIRVRNRPGIDPKLGSRSYPQKSKKVCQKSAIPGSKFGHFFEHFFGHFFGGVQTQVWRIGCRRGRFF